MPVPSFVFKKSYSMMFILILSSILIFSLVPVGIANPIPVPTLNLLREDIYINLDRMSSSYLTVDVRGVYPFANIGYENVTMFFPVPPQVLLTCSKLDFEVWMSDRKEELPWTVADKGYVMRNGEREEFTYETVDGTYPLVQWNIEDVPDRFEITVEYSYQVGVKDSEFKTLYAMATGRFADVYGKRCTAYVTVNLARLKGYDMEISLVPPPSLAMGSSKFRHTVESNNETYYITEESEMFNGLRRDVMVSLKNETKEEEYEWRQYTPKDVNLKVDVFSEGYVNVTTNMLFNHGGFKVDWGQIIHPANSSKIAIDSAILEWTGPAPAVMLNMTHTYDIGQLEPGTYTLDYNVNNSTVKTLDFIVEGTGPKSSSDPVEPAAYLLLGLPVAAVVILATKKISAH